MQHNEIFKKVDHTLLERTATWSEIKQIVDDAITFGVASVCIPPSYVKQVSEYSQGRIPVCTVIGFPNGYNTTKVKGYETKEAIENGADEIDMVINLGWLKEKNYSEIEKEITQIKAICKDKILKVIIETCLLSDEEKIKMCEIVTKAGADYIKTSTGFSHKGATFDDVALFATHIGSSVKIKAAGGISSFKDAEDFIRLGASRLGTSRIIKLAKEEQVDKNSY